MVFIEVDQTVICAFFNDLLKFLLDEFQYGEHEAMTLLLSPLHFNFLDLLMEFFQLFCVHFGLIFALVAKEANEL